MLPLSKTLPALTLLAACVVTAPAEDTTTTPTPTPTEEPACDVPPFNVGDDPCSAPLTPGSDRKCTFEFAGQQRSFLVYAPANYDPCAPTAMVVDAHGATESAEQHAGLVPFKTWPGGLGSGWRLLADREGIIIVTPQGVGDAWYTSDVDFIVEVQKRVAAIADVDPAKVYLTGISNGGFLNYWTACRDLSTVFRGYAPIAGAVDATIPCAVSSGAPLIAFHAPGDTIVPYSYGQQAAAKWAAANHCDPQPAASMTFAGGAVDERALCLASEAGDQPPWRLEPCASASPATTCVAWNGCDNGNNVTLCDVSASSQPVGGHILYFNDSRLSLAAVAWEFFKQFHEPVTRAEQ